mmetsp:Transcript_7702/g.19989  ORF Transcript_7702/g.19989 Transcript_7702/m.19989 type:complete len:323 (+) Transcript_7702:309-1277(+)
MPSTPQCLHITLIHTLLYHIHVFALNGLGQVQTALRLAQCHFLILPPLVRSAKYAEGVEHSHQCLQHYLPTFCQAHCRHEPPPARPAQVIIARHANDQLGLVIARVNEKPGKVEEGTQVCLRLHVGSFEAQIRVKRGVLTFQRVCHTLPPPLFICSSTFLWHVRAKHKEVRVEQQLAHFHHRADLCFDHAVRPIPSIQHRRNALVRDFVHLFQLLQHTFQFFSLFSPSLLFLLLTAICRPCHSTIKPGDFSAQVFRPRWGIQQHPLYFLLLRLLFRHLVHGDALHAFYVDTAKGGREARSMQAAQKGESASSGRVETSIGRE